MKKKNKFQNIVHIDFVTLYGLPPGSAASKAKLKNHRSVFLVGKDSYRKDFRVVNR